MTWIADWMAAVWLVLVESGPFLLGGFFVAGLIHVFLPEERIYRHLGRDDFGSVVFASLCGAPLPLCSCSVVPTAVALKRAGASKGATTSFLIATPETGVDSIGVTWALMDPLMTVVRPIAAVLTALVSGTLVNLLVRSGRDVDPSGAEEAGGKDLSCACEEDSGDAHGHDAGSGANGLLARLRAAVTYAFGPLLADLTPWFILGFTISGFIVLWVPDGFFERTDLPRVLAMFAMLGVGVPMYICATASTPVAAALVAKGLDPGAALVLLLAGPATNVATWLVVREFLGRKVLAIYLATIAGCALAFGYVIDFFYRFFDIDPVTVVRDASSRPVALFSVRGLGGLVLLLLLLDHAVRGRLDRRFGARLRAWCAPLGFDPTRRAVKVAVLAALLVLWLASGVGVVRVGETGFLLRFGGVRRVLERPQLIVHWPWPIERLERVRRDEIRYDDFGLDLGAPDPNPRDLAAEAEVLAGNENLLKITWTVHWRARDAYRLRFGVAAADEVVRALSEAALRKVCSRRSSDDLLVADRAELEEAVRAELAADPIVAAAGVDVVSVQLHDVHAPPQTHFAYRDVASQEEYAVRAVLEAEAERIRRLAKAESDAYTQLQDASGRAQRRLAQASGEAKAFRDLAEVRRDLPRGVAFGLGVRALEALAAGARRLVAVLSPSIEVVVLPPGTPVPEAAAGPPGESNGGGG